MNAGRQENQRSASLTLIAKAAMIEVRTIEALETIGDLAHHGPAETVTGARLAGRGDSSFQPRAADRDVDCDRRAWDEPIVVVARNLLTAEVQSQLAKTLQEL